MKIAIIGNGVSGILSAYKLIQHAVSNNKSLDILFIDPNLFGGNTYNRSDVTVGMANPISHLGIPYKKHAYDAVCENPGFWKKVLPQESIANKDILLDEHITHNQYGMYLRGFVWDLINQVIAHQPNIRIYKLDQRAIQYDESKMTLQLEDHTTVQINKMILATGNVEPAVFNHLKGAKKYYNCDDTATDKKHANETNDMVILGMGNGAHYTALNAFNNGFKGVITLVSKDGKKPLPNLKFGKPYELKILTPENVNKMKAGVAPEILSAHIKNLFLKELKVAKQNGFDVYDVVDAASRNADRYWRMLDIETKDYLLKTLLINFNNARFRIPEGHIKLLNQLCAEGKLVYRSGIKNISVMENGNFKLTFNDNSTLITSKIVNNTGPSKWLNDRDPFMKSLAAQGIIKQHPLGGIQVSDDLRVIGKNGVNDSIYAVGPIVAGEFLNAFTVNDIQMLVDNFLNVKHIMKEDSTPSVSIRSRL